MSMWDDEAGYSYDDPKHPDFASGWFAEKHRISSRGRSGMSETTTLVITDIPEPKTGTGKKGKWTRYAFKDGNDEFFSTFQKSVFDPAYELQGKKAKVTYEVDGDFKNIVAIEPAEQSQNGASGEDEPDWDLIGLRKTRCVLWEAILPVGMQAGISAWTKAAQGEYDSAQLAGFVVRFGRTLRMIAEADIFLSDPVEDPDDWIPFLGPKAKKQPGEDVPI